jgi:acyl-coenzyme A synthetase/AMP-(fatty) acid ligase
MTRLEIKKCFGQPETAVFAVTFPWMQIKHGSMGKSSAEWCVDIVDGENNFCDPRQENKDRQA